MADGRVTVITEIEIDGEVLKVSACSLVEAISAVPMLEATVTGPEGAPDPAALVGKPLRAVFRRADHGAMRTFVGKVIEVERSADADGNPTVKLRAAPRLWRLGKRADCRVYQEKTVPEIVADVLERAGIPSSEQTLKLGGSYEPRTYVVQYRETDLELVTRLLSEEGIYFTVEYQDDKDTVVLGDDPTGLADVEGAKIVPFGATFGFETSRPHVNWIRQRHQIQPDKVTLRDYDFERPKYKLEAKVEGKDDGPKALEVYVFPGRFTDDGAGKHYAEVLLDSMQAERDVVTGEATVLTLAPGRRFEIEGHPYAPLNQEYLVTSVHTETRERRSFHGKADPGGRDYVCRFTAVPTKKVQYRPPRAARARSIPGIALAVTTGPSGSEIHSDEHGRVKAQFPWDRLGKNDDASSVWMRTSQIPTGGSMLLPRVGWEVVVAHAEGDPDTPLVMSRLYNALTPPPYALPGGKARGAIQTATTPGGGSSNELRTDDTAGAEEMFFNASKDMNVDVVNNTTESIGNNETHDIGANHQVNVTNSVILSVGSSQTVDVGGNQNVHVETFMVDQCGGDHSLTIGGNRDMKVGGDHKRSVAGSSSVDVGAIHTDLVVGSVNESVVANLSVDVGAALAEMTAGDRGVTIGGSHSEKTGAAKVVIAVGGRGVEIGGTMMHKVAGAIITKVDGDRSEEAGATYTEVAAGARILKADNVVFEGEAIVSLVMGASTVTLTPASVSIAGVSVKLDGATAETAALVLDN